MNTNYDIIGQGLFLGVARMKSKWAVCRYISYSIVSRNRDSSPVAIRLLRSLIGSFDLAMICDFCD